MEREIARAKQQFSEALYLGLADGAHGNWTFWSSTRADGSSASSMRRMTSARSRMRSIRSAATSSAGPTGSTRTAASSSATPTRWTCLSASDQFGAECCC
jgi:hypothetical protein